MKFLKGTAREGKGAKVWVNLDAVRYVWKQNGSDNHVLVLEHSGTIQVQLDKISEELLENLAQGKEDAS